MNKQKVIMAQAISALVTILAADPDREIEVELHGRPLKIRMTENGDIMETDQRGWTRPIENGTPSWSTWRRWVEYLAMARDTDLPPDTPLPKANRLTVLCDRARQIVDEALN